MYASPLTLRSHRSPAIVLTGAGMRLQEAMEGCVTDIAKHFCSLSDRHDPEEVSDALRTELSGKIPQILQAGGAPTLDYTCGHDTAKDGCYRLMIGTNDPSGLGMVSPPIFTTSIVDC